MASNFLTNLLQKATNVPTRLSNALLGTPVQIAQPQNTVSPIYPDNLQTYIDEELPTQAYSNKLYNNNALTKGLTKDEIHRGLANGLNFGVPEIANAQKEMGINIPQGNEQIAQARAGNFNQYPMTAQSGVAETQRQGGILRDFAKGYRDNYDNGMNINQWGDKSNWATRLGEGLGSVGRFVDSPVGRFAITAGTIGALGGTPAEMAAYGVTAGVGRQKAKTEDAFYRNQLEKQGIDTTGIGGNFTSDMYKNYVNAQKLNNQVKWGDLAELSPQIAEAIQKNPDLAESFAPATVVNQILKSGLTDAQIANLIAKTDKAKAETENIKNPKPKVTINVKKGETKSIVEHRNTSGGSSTSSKVPTKTSTSYKEGQTATNPSTGEKLIFRGGKWQVM